LTRRYVAWTLRHGKLLWALAVLLAIPAAWRTAMLYGHLRSDIEELLPRDAPSVVAIAELRRRMSGLQYLGVLVDTGGPAHLAEGERFLDDLAARIRRYPRTEVSDVRTGFAAERACTGSTARRPARCWTTTSRPRRSTSATSIASTPASWAAAIWRATASPTGGWA
jgi:hypothetical protein